VSRRNTVKKLYAVSRSIAQARGGSTLRCFADALHCSYVHGASPENYMVLRFFALSEAERKTYLTSGRSKAVDARLNARATAHDRQVLARKDLFDRAFSPLIKRDFLYAPESSPADFSAFLSRHEEFFVKPVSGTMGRGVARLRSSAVDADALYTRCRAESLLLEEPIVQHPALSRLNPSCVNSVRINAARSLGGEVRLIGACLKCGGAAAVTDNFHTGGVAYPIDWERGVVSGPGRNNLDLRDYDCHPVSGVTMPGFRLPFWGETLDCVRRAMDLVPSIGYVGWDIAITPSGPELIEGNYHWPGGNIIQFDNVGKYPLLLSCLGEDHE